MTFGILFDCDGVLLDSMSMWHQTEQRLTEVIASPMDADDLKHFYSMPSDALARYLNHKYGAHAEIEDMISLTRDAVFEYYRDEVCAREGAGDYLRMLHSSGYVLAVVSASPLACLQAGLSRVGFYDYFSAVISADDWGIAKAEPRLYQKACELIQVDCHNAWGIDDSAFALRAMRTAGLRTVGLFDPLNRSCSFADLEAQANIAVRSYDQLPPGLFSVRKGP
ncbi:MAG: HAD family phosphatase [Actinomycetia bacterium]|nr:HAD family phosphatase [Actinomycetes bacterium]